MRMPRSRPLTVIGTPEMLCPLMISRASPTVAPGGRVIGSTITPFSDRLTFSTSRACSFDRHVLVDDAQPPSCARAMASSASVTVSIGLDRIGMLSGILAVRWVLVSTCLGSSSENSRFEQHVVERDPLVCDTILHGKSLQGRDDVGKDPSLDASGRCKVPFPAH